MLCGFGDSLYVLFVVGFVCCCGLLVGGGYPLRCWLETVSRCMVGGGFLPYFGDGSPSCHEDDDDGGNTEHRK